MFLLYLLELFWFFLCSQKLFFFFGYFFLAGFSSSCELLSSVLTSCFINYSSPLLSLLWPSSSSLSWKSTYLIALTFFGASYLPFLLLCLSCMLALYLLLLSPSDLLLAFLKVFWVPWFLPVGQLFLVLFCNFIFETVIFFWSSCDYFSNFLISSMVFKISCFACSFSNTLFFNNSDKFLGIYCVYLLQGWTEVFFVPFCQILWVPCFCFWGFCWTWKYHELTPWKSWTRYLLALQCLCSPQD